MMTRLRRALDALYEQDVTALYAQLSAQAARRLGLKGRVGHLDSTSFHVDGEYNSAEPPEARLIHITPGYSRDHRPDLNQVVLALMTEHQAGLPLWMKPLSGNGEDKAEFKQAVEAHLDQMRQAAAMDYLIAVSRALYRRHPSEPRAAEVDHARARHGQGGAGGDSKRLDRDSDAPR
jgi:transposase